MKLGIYGGTFSPVHNGHVRAAEAFVEACELDKLLIIPAGIPPHKEMRGNATQEQRLEMCRLAFADIPNTEVSDIELRRKGKSYTVMTVRELEQSDRDLFLLCGTDMILTFDGWFCFEEIMKKCTLVFVRRENDSEIAAELDRKLALYRERYGAEIKQLCVPALEMSSTEARKSIADGGDASSMLPPKVLEYVKRNNLYTE